MRIAYVVRHIDSAGGRERVLTNKANYLVRRFGYEVFIITTLQVDERTVFGLDARVHVRHLKLGDRESYPGSRLGYALYLRRALQSELREISPDITVSMWWGAEFRVLPFIGDGSRKVLEFHSSQFMRSYSHRPDALTFPQRMRWAGTRWLDDCIVDRYDRFVVLTHEDRRAWRKRNVAVIPNAVSFALNEASECADPVIMSAGRLTESKGFDRLIDIWAELEPLYPAWTLRIYGDGEARHELTRKIESKGLKNVVLRQTTSNIEAEMLQASIFVFTSRYEGFGMVMLEAMQCGLPVVSYNTQCGPSEIVDDGVSGFLVEEGDPVTFVERLRRLIEDPALRREMGAAGKRLAVQRFSEDAVMAEWKKLFEAVAPAQ